MSKTLVTLRADQTLDEVRHWIATRAAGTSHQGFAVLLDGTGALAGVVTRRHCSTPTSPARSASRSF
jgi:hypothetical protein